MEGQAWLKIGWEIANSPAGIALIGAALVWLLNKLYAAKPSWQKWEGSIIAAVKWAEKNIPDSTENAGLRRADEALRLVLKAYSDGTGYPANREMAATLANGISIIHSILEAQGQLRKPAGEDGPELEESK